MSVVAGEVRICGFSFAPKGWLACQGQELKSSEYPELYKAIGTAFGGDGDGTFRLPDLQGRAPIHAGQSADGKTYQVGDAGGTTAVTLTSSQIPAHGHALPASTATGVSASPESRAYAASQAQQYTPLGSDVSGAWLKQWGGNQPHENRMPYVTVNYIIATTSAALENAEGDKAAGADQSGQARLPGQIGYFGTTLVPDGWLPCNGEAAGIPDLRGRFVLGADEYYPMGRSAGEATHTLRPEEMPTHYHSLAASNAAGDTGDPAWSFPALYDGPRGPLYGAHVDTSLPVSSFAGNGQAHDNMPPFVTLNVCSDPDGSKRGEAFLGEIRCANAAWHDKSWLPCDGSAVSMRSAPALYSLLAEYYGGNGVEFLLPKLDGSIACGLTMGEDPGERGGAATVTLSSDELPAHGHAARVSRESGQRQDAPAPDTYPTMVVVRGGSLELYATPAQQADHEVLMLPSQPAGGGGPHNNMAPYTALHFYICVNGFYPTRAA